MIMSAIKKLAAEIESVKQRMDAIEGNGGNGNGDSVTGDAGVESKSGEGPTGSEGPEIKKDKEDQKGSLATGDTGEAIKRQPVNDAVFVPTAMEATRRR